MIEFKYKYSNRSLNKKKLKPEWLTGAWISPSNLINEEYNFDNLSIRINGKIYNKDSDEFRNALEKEHIWRRLND